jgi:hypothetical protein
MEITAEIVRELFDYAPDTGVLSWRERELKWFSSQHACSAWNSRFAGKRAGGLVVGESGYRRRSVAVFNKKHLEHRIIWMWMTGEEPPANIDHDNRDATDNRWVNIASSTPLANQHNLSRNINNRSGVTGVHWHKGAGKWAAGVTLNRKAIHLGLFEEIDEAAMAVLEFRAENGFHKGHGLELAHYHAAPNA